MTLLLFVFVDLVLQVSELQAGASVIVSSSAIDPEVDELEEREAAALAEREEQAKEEKKRMRSELEALINEKK